MQFVLPDTETDLKARYSEPQRFYHNMDHLNYCLQAFARLCGLLTAYELNRPTTDLIGKMIWFHDAVYDIGPHVVHGENERQSAELFTQSKDSKLDANGMYHTGAVEISRGILMSAEHTKTFGRHIITPAQKIFLDIDLCGMGDTYDMFVHNGELIRKEYAWVDSDTFMRNRVKFFQMLMKRPYIYYNHVMRGMYEESTRSNINRWIKENT